MRKISLLLCFSIVLSLVMSCPVTFADDSYTQADVSIGAEFLEAMNINDPAKDKADDGVITRAEAVEVITKLFGYSASSEEAVPFTDVKGTLTGALKYALDLKMISESESFRPDDAITYNEAFKMCVVALGYDYLAKTYGGWPSGYVRMAGEAKLSDGLPTHEVTISKDAFYLFVENLLTAEMLEMDGVVDSEISYRKYTTVLETYFNLYEIEGVVTATCHTGLYAAEDALDEAEIAIDDAIYRFEGKSNYIGKHVKAYAYKDKDELAVVVPYDNRIKTVAFSDLTEVEGNTVYYDVDNKENRLRVEDVPAVIYNGKSDGKAKISDFSGKNGHFVFTDNDGDNTYEVCEANEYRTVVVSGVNAVEGYINDKNTEKRVDLSGDDCVYFVYDNGVEKTLGDITENSLLSVYESSDKLLVTVVIENATVNGTVTGFKVGTDAIEINDVSYPYSEYFKKNYLPKIKSGSEITVNLSSDGIVHSSSEPERDKILFGYYLNAKQGSGLDSTIKVKFVDNKGAIVITDVNDKLTCNGTVYTKPDDILSVFFDSQGNKKLDEQLFRYKLTSDGLLTLIDTVCDEEGYIDSSSDKFEDNLKKYKYPERSEDLVHDGIWIESTTGIVHPWYAIKNDTYIIQVNPNTDIAEDKRFAVRDLNWLKSTKQFIRNKATVYNVDEYLGTGALVLSTAADDTVNDESPLGIVHSVTKALDTEMNECYKIVVFSRNSYNDIYVYDEDLINKYVMDEQGNMLISAGDCIRYEKDNLGYLTALAVDYDFSEGKLLHKNTNQMYLCYYYGGVYSIGNGIMTMVRAKDDGTLDIDHQKYAFQIPSTVMIYDSESGEITNGSVHDLESYLQTGDECTRVMVITEEFDMQMCVVYR
ncbi:MAG: hypothetical protein II998_07295 [Clostridia bacterium]|nr:hypothetical protein [Clostridia bacterium]